MSTSSNERILVCVNYGHHGSKLIKRGAALASQLNAPLSILVFDSLPEEEYKHDKKIDMSLFKELADEYGADLSVEKSNAYNITNVISNFAKEKQATQIVIGQIAENLWTTLLGGSIIDTLLEKAPFADLHVVPKERADETDNWNFERGVSAYLVEQADGTYELRFDDSKGFSFEGVFFKELQTDFNSGIFSFTKDSHIFEVRVDDGTVRRLVDIDET